MSFFNKAGKPDVLATPAGPLLSVTGLSVHYGKVSAVADANIKVEAGRIVTVIGGNGAGKSTLLNSIMGALPHTGRSMGSVRYSDQEVGAWQVERRVSAGMSL